MNTKKKTIKEMIDEMVSCEYGLFTVKLESDHYLSLLSELTYLEDEFPVDENFENYVVTYYPKIDGCFIDICGVRSEKIWWNADNKNDYSIVLKVYKNFLQYKNDLQIERTKKIEKLKKVGYSQYILLCEDEKALYYCIVTHHLYTEEEADVVEIYYVFGDKQILTCIKGTRKVICKEKWDDISLVDIDYYLDLCEIEE